jgi:hypothetical protein
VEAEQVPEIGERGVDDVEDHIAAALSQRCKLQRGGANPRRAEDADSPLGILLADRSADVLEIVLLEVTEADLAARKRLVVNNTLKPRSRKTSPTGITV